jgi:hypothetical protein
MTKIFMAVMLGAALASCTEGYQARDTPVPANGPTTLTPKYNTQASPNFQVTIYKDPGGCQYLVFNDLGYSSTVAVVPRTAAGSGDYCISSDTP